VLEKKEAEELARLCKTLTADMILLIAAMDSHAAAPTSERHDTVRETTLRLVHTAALLHSKIDTLLADGHAS